MYEEQVLRDIKSVNHYSRRAEAITFTQTPTILVQCVPEICAHYSLVSHSCRYIKAVFRIRVSKLTLLLQILGPMDLGFFFIFHIALLQLVLERDYKQHKLTNKSFAFRIVPGSGTNFRGVAGSGTVFRCVPASVTNFRSVPGSATNSQSVPGSGTNFRRIAGSATNFQSVPGSGTNFRRVAGSGTDFRSVPGSATDFRVVLCSVPRTKKNADSKHCAQVHRQIKYI